MIPDGLFFIYLFHLKNHIFYLVYLLFILFYLFYFIFI